MTAEQALMIHLVNAMSAEVAADVEIASSFGPRDQPVDETTVDAEWARMMEHETVAVWLRDSQNDLRHSGISTGLSPRGHSRHYECREVAALIDGRWVGWTYWHGGGKHSEPAAIAWMDGAYFLDVTEEQRTITVRTFTNPKTGESGPPKAANP
jgi:hypothetical protein